MSVEARPVRFTRMQDGSPEEFATVKLAEREQKKRLPGRILNALQAIEDEGVGGYQVNRTQHSLQSATRAHRNGEDTDYVVAALCHDLGDILAPYSHGALAAAVLKPFVSPRLTWIIDHHPIFTLYHYGQFVGQDPNLRDRYKDHEWFEDAAYFVANYDENCFDPDYDNLPMDFFVPMVHEVFGREPASF